MTGALEGIQGTAPITESEREGFSIPVDSVLLNHILSVGSGDVTAH